MDQNRIVLLIGSTGSGKSTLANVISGNEKNIFEEGEYGVSKTKFFRKETIQVDNFSYTIVDTTGIGDTELETKEVLLRIADACYAVQNGFHQVFFVTRNKFTESEKFAYNMLRSTVFNAEVVKYTTIIRTGFKSFRSPEKCEEDIKMIKEENPDFADIFSSCNKVLHVNNLSKEEEDSLESRKEAHLKLAVHLQGCNTIYMPNELGELNHKIENFQTEREKYQSELETINSKLDQAKKDLDDVLVKTNEAEQKRIQAQLEESKNKIATSTHEHVKQKNPSFWGEVGDFVGGLVTSFTKCVIQ